MRSVELRRTERCAATVALLLLISWSADAAPRYPWLGDQPVRESLAQRIEPPPDYQRIPAAEPSFAAWLRGLPLREAGALVRLYDGRQRSSQSGVFAVVDIDVGRRDLQQCADAVIRLRAEYLRAAGCAEDLSFNFTSGHPARWSDWSAGRRPIVSGSRVTWTPQARPDSSYGTFRAYLDSVFSYAGTSSLTRELKVASDPATVRPGDVFIQGGSPGHAVLVADVAENPRGERMFLLVQSYMPAQDIHVLANPSDGHSPWYPARKAGPLETPDWFFSYSDLRRFAEPGCAAGDHRTAAAGDRPLRTVSPTTAGEPGWKPLAAGMDLGTLATGTPSPVGDSRITLLRIDPDLWDLEFVGRSLTGEAAGRTAREWCRTRNLSAAINAGMFGDDYKTHTGYLRFREHVNSSRANRYQSVAAFDPRAGKELPRFRIFDLDEPGTSLPLILRDYSSAVQNLRLIKRPGSNRWGPQQKKWSEAALGEDAKGRIIFIFCRSPFSMHDLNKELLASGTGLVASQHLEGGPEAQLYAHIGETEIDLFGSYETSFNEDDGNTAPWPVPNVLGVRPRAEKK